MFKKLLSSLSQSELSAFADIVRPMFTLIQRLATKNANLRRTRDLLLPRLLSGQINLTTK